MYRYFSFHVDTFDIQKYRYVSIFIDDIPVTIHPADPIFHHVTSGCSQPSNAAYMVCSLRTMQKS